MSAGFVSLSEALETPDPILDESANGLRQGGAINRCSISYYVNGLDPISVLRARLSCPLYVVKGTVSSLWKSVLTSAPWRHQQGKVGRPSNPQSLSYSPQLI